MRPVFRKPLTIVLLLAAAVLGSAATVATVGKGHGNFSQYPGFAEHFLANPPSDELPDAEAQALLEKYRPRFYLPDGHRGPVNFYKDYIGHGSLFEGDGSIISSAVTREQLNAHKERPDVEFVHRPGPDGWMPESVIYGLYETAAIDIGDDAEDLTFLTYHAVFPHSGLPAGLLGWQTLALGLVGDLDDWHQLDHYTAATVVLDSTREPVALILQHHNYHQTHLFGEDVQYPEDGRVKLDVSIRSNELYPHRTGRTNRPAVSFLNRKAWRYMIGAGPRLMLTADDITEPVRELKYDLRFLAPSDAFYTFKGYLGERRLLMGRSGPPGAYYKTLPEFMNFERQLLVGYWRRGNRHDINTLLRAEKQRNHHMEFATAQGAVFRANLLCVKRWKNDCAFQ